MKKVLFEEIKKSLIHPNTQGQMDTAIHIKKINSKNQAEVKSVQKSNELAYELVEYYKLQQNDRNDTLNFKQDQHNSPQTKLKTDESSIRSKTPSSNPYLNDSFLKVGQQLQQQSKELHYLSQYPEQNDKNLSTLQNQHIFFDVGVNFNHKKELDMTQQQQKKQVIIRKKNQKNQILNALAQNRLNLIQNRQRAESMNTIFDNKQQGGQHHKNNQRCLTSQHHEREDDLDQRVMPNFENSILANNFNNLTCKTKQLFEKYQCKQNEISPIKKPFNYFIRSNYKKQQQMQGQKSSSIDLQNIQCLSQEYIQKNEIQQKQQQQPNEDKQQIKSYYDRSKRMSQPDMSKQKESEIFIDEYLKTVKLSNKQNLFKITQLSQEAQISSQQNRPLSRIHTSISPQKQRNETPLTKKIASLKKSNQIKHNTILSQKNSIAIENLSKILSQSQDLESQDFDDGQITLSLNKKRNQSFTKNSNPQLYQQQQQQQLNNQNYQQQINSIYINFPQQIQKHSSIEQNDSAFSSIFYGSQLRNQSIKLNLQSHSLPQNKPIFSQNNKKNNYYQMQYMTPLLVKL